jgi:hypothetical protein
MANEDKILKILLQIQSDVSDLGKLKGGVDDLKKGIDDAAKSGFSLGDAFKFAGAQEALSGLIDLVKQVGEEMKNVVEGAIEKAAEIQTEEFPLTQMLQDSGAAAEEILGKVNSLWQQFGVVSNEAIGNAARNLLIMGTPAENLTNRLTELTKISLATGVSLNDAVSAFSRMRVAIETDTAPMTRGMGGFGAATFEMLKLLEESMGKTEGQIRTMFRQGQISLPDLLDAFQKATEAGGKFGDVIELKRQTFEGAVQAMKTAWQGIEVEMGKPIIDTLTPVINRVAEIERAFARIAEEHGWADTVRLAWEIVIDEVALAWQTTLSEAFSKIGPAFIAAWHAMWEAINNEMAKGISSLSNEGIKRMGDAAGAAFTSAFAAAFGSNLPAELESKKALLEDAINSVFSNLPKGEGLGPGLGLGPEVPENLDKVGKKVNEVSVAIRELETVLQSIRQQQQVISTNPLLGVGEKDQALVKSYTQELQALYAEIAKLTALKAGPLDPGQLTEVNQKLQQANAEVQLLDNKLVGLTHPLQASLAQWVNSFGTAAQQLGKTIEGSINAALQATNQLLLDAVFRTGNWQQTLQGVERQIINLFLTFLEQLALQRIAALLGITTTTTAKVASGVAIAAANAPAAAASSIATDGVSAEEGSAAALAAIAEIEGALVVHEGGSIKRRRMHAGGLAHDEVPLIGQEGEIMIQKSVAEQPGMTDFLLALNAGDLFHNGGRLGGRLGAGRRSPSLRFGARRTRGRRGPRGGEFAHFLLPGANTFGSFSFGGRQFDSLSQMAESAPGLFEDMIDRGDVPPFEEPSPLPSPEPNPFGTYDPNVFINQPWMTPGGGPGPGGIPTEGLGPTWAERGYDPGQYDPAWQYSTMGPYIPGTPFFTPEGNITTIGPSGYPQAIPLQPFSITANPADLDPGAIVSQIPMTQHSGGRISRRSMHVGGMISRMHSGGSVGGAMRGAGVHIYAFTDLKEIIKHMGSREGQKIIFDTVQGRRIDLGIG